MQTKIFMEIQSLTKPMSINDAVLESRTPYCRIGYYPGAMKTWLFQANPKRYNVRSALLHFRSIHRPITWLVNRYRKEVQPGDEVYFWESGPEAGLVGWGTVGTPPAPLPLEEEELPFVLLRAQFEGPQIRVRVRVDGVCYQSRSELRKDPKFLKYRAIANGNEDTNFAVPPEIASELSLLVRK
jgi:hypothetical protein